MSRRFHTGTLVRVCQHEYKGHVGEVIGSHSTIGGGSVVFVKLRRVDTVPLWFDSRNLVAYEDIGMRALKSVMGESRVPKFKLGQEVRVVPQHGVFTSLSGRKGKVISIRTPLWDDPPVEYEVKFKNPIHGIISHTAPEESFRAVVPDVAMTVLNKLMGESAKPEFTMGQKVRVVLWPGAVLHGKVGKVDKIYGPYFGRPPEYEVVFDPPIGNIQSLVCVGHHLARVHPDIAMKVLNKLMNEE